MALKTINIIIGGVGLILLAYGVWPVMQPAIVDGGGEPCPEGTHYDIRYDECVPDDEETVDCDPGTHWDPSEGRCMPDHMSGGGGGGCNNTEHWDSNLRRCVENDEPVCRWIFILLGLFCMFIAVFWKGS